MEQNRIVSLAPAGLGDANTDFKQRVATTVGIAKYPGGFVNEESDQTNLPLICEHHRIRGHQFKGHQSYISS
eukprot:scaffold12707_cov67-Skeletonema_dohrnii-CCMP3373.AAC.2